MMMMMMMMMMHLAALAAGGACAQVAAGNGISVVLTDEGQVASWGAHKQLPRRMDTHFGRVRACVAVGCWVLHYITFHYGSITLWVLHYITAPLHYGSCITCTPNT
jgi:hypothetical protein